MRLGTVVITIALAGTTLGACSDRAMSPPPPPPPTTVDVAYCSGLEPTWVAFQDGDGAWTQAQPIVSGPHTTFRYAF